MYIHCYLNSTDTIWHTCTINDRKSIKRSFINGSKHSPDAVLFPGPGVMAVVIWRGVNLCMCTCLPQPPSIFTYSGASESLPAFPGMSVIPMYLLLLVRLFKA